MLLEKALRWDCNVFSFIVIFSFGYGGLFGFVNKNNFHALKVNRVEV